MLRGAGAVRARAGHARRALAGLILALGLSAGAPARSAASAPDGFFGVNTQTVFNLSSAQVDAHLSAMSSGGLQIARHDASWISIEPNPPDPSTGQHTYSWSGTDGMVASLASHGLRWYPTLDYSTTWSGQTANDPMSAPQGTANYAAYAAALAKRYGRGGSFWQAHPELAQLPVIDYEIWNEENFSMFWHPQSDAPEQYADLYIAARSAIRDVDPQARVVVGGLALSNSGITDEVEFLNRMFQHRPDLGGNVDAVGLHPYQATVSDVYARIRRFRQAVDGTAGAPVPIEITEIGWTSTYTSESDRAADLSQLAEDLPRSDCTVDRLIPHTWITDEANQSNPEDWFGIFNHDATPKPSGQAYLDAVRTMRGLTGTPPPTATVAICYGADPAAPAPVEAAVVQGAQRLGPRLLLRVHRDRRRSRLDVIARCPAGCRLRVDLMARRARAAGNVRIVRRTTRFSSRRQVVNLRISRRLKRRGPRVELDVLAIGRTGGQTARSRSVRIR